MTIFWFCDPLESKRNISKHILDSTMALSKTFLIFFLTLHSSNAEK